MERFKEFLKSVNSEWKTGLSIALAIIFIFSLGNIAGSLTNINATPSSSVEGNADNTADTQATTEAITAAPTTAAPTAAPTTAAPVTEATQAPTVAPTQATDSSATEATQATDTAPAPSTGAPTTPAEIIALFNESANKIKTNASKTTRNYQDMQITKIEVPSALQSLADSMVEKFLKPDFTPVEWTGADIAEKYPVGGTDFVSKLTEADVQNITCTDNGTEYEIVIYLNSHEDPVYRSGEGVNSVFWVMNKDDISNNVPGLQSSKLFYHDCKVTAKIDKATGNMTYARYEFNFDIDVTIKVIASLDAFVSILVDEEYVIEY